MFIKVLLGFQVDSKLGAALYTYIHTHTHTHTHTYILSCNHKHKTYVSTPNVINSLSYTPQGYCMTRVESQTDTTSMTSRTEYSTQTPKKSTVFSGQYLHNH